jgi:superfamily II DNA or RNA helicase
MLNKQIRSKLLPYQIPHTEKLISCINKYGGAVDGSVTGSGKTYTSLAITKHLGLTPLIIAPKNILPGWKKVAQYMGVEPFIIINYEALKYNKYNFMYYDKKNEWLEWRLPKNIIFIYDEAHLASNISTINAHMIFTSATYYPTIALSATFGDSPEHMFTPGYITKMFSAEEYPIWLQNISYKLVSVGGIKRFFWSFFLLPTDFFVERGDSEKCQLLHHALFVERGSRMGEKEVKEFFPEGQIYPELIDFNSHVDKINEIYSQMNKELSALADKISGDGNSALTIRLRARQQVELLKVPILVDYTKSLIVEGNSVVIFTNFRDSLSALCEQLNTKCCITGGNKNNEKNRVSFQADEERIIIVNIKSGGAGLNLDDRNGNYPRISLILPSDSAKDVKQALGRIHRSGTKTLTIQKIICAEKTIEEKVYKNLERKIKNIDEINDGDL